LLLCASIFIKLLKYSLNAKYLSGVQGSSCSGALPAPSANPSSSRSQTGGCLNSFSQPKCLVSWFCKIDPFSTLWNINLRNLAKFYNDYHFVKVERRGSSGSIGGRGGLQKLALLLDPFSLVARLMMVLVERAGNRRETRSQWPQYEDC